jgi:basic membrane lipoprotein Med (substrate-binding protein (PBP1-ABC) superfamily)
MRLKIFAALLLAASLFAVPISGAMAQVDIEGDPKVAFIYFNVKDDGGWVQAQDEARMKLEADTGYETAYTEGVEEVASKLRAVVERYIRRGYNVIAASGFGYNDALLEISNENPNVAFFNAPGTVSSDNLEGYYARTYESQFLCGMVAGAMTKTNKIGFVAAVPLSLTNWNVNAWHLGAQMMNPDVETHVIFTNAWYDPVKERATAQALVEQGVDFLGQHQDTPSTQIVAEEAGIYSSGYHRDMSEYSSATQCSSVWAWERYITPTVKNIAAGPWKSSGIRFLGIKDGGTDMVCCGSAVPKDVADKIKAVREEIVNGTRHVFQGPFNRQDGSQVIGAGESLDDGGVWGMTYLVEGVVGELPQ